MCFTSFGVQHSRTAWECINEKCGVLFCNECFESIQTYNGNNKPFRCMYCLKAYETNQLPEKNQRIMDKLCSEALIKYDIKHTRQLLLNECISSNLISDIDCRRRQLNNLISTCERYTGRISMQNLIENAKNIVKDLMDIVVHLQMITNGSLTICKNAY